MRNRPDISYLTILGLSLTVVIAMQKGDSCEDSVKFKLSDADGHHICFLSVDAVRDAFLAVSHEKTSFIFGYNTPSCSALTSSVKVLVDINAPGFKGISPFDLELDKHFLTKDNISDMACTLMSSASSIKRPNLAGFPVLQRSDLNSSLHLSAFPVRAGPEGTI